MHSKPVKKLLLDHAFKELRSVYSSKIKKCDESRSHKKSGVPNRFARNTFGSTCIKEKCLFFGPFSRTVFVATLKLLFTLCQQLFNSSKASLAFFCSSAKRYFLSIESFALLEDDLPDALLNLPRILFPAFPRSEFC